MKTNKELRNEFAGKVSLLTNHIGNGDDFKSNDIASAISNAVILWSMGRLCDGINILTNKLSEQ